MLPPQWSLCNVVLRSPVGAKAERTQSEGRKENVGKTDIIRIFAIGKRGNIMLIDSIESTKKDYFECEKVEKHPY